MPGGTDIRSPVRTFPVSDFDQALDRVHKGSVRHRAVVQFG
ncbi:hypothetical protein ACFU9Y_03110 [Streptomyces sp. NPDC057621]